MGLNSNQTENSLVARSKLSPTNDNARDAIAQHENTYLDCILNNSIKTENRIQSVDDVSDAPTVSNYSGLNIMEAHFPSTGLNNNITTANEKSKWGCKSVSISDDAHGERTESKFGKKYLKDKFNTDSIKNARDKYFVGFASNPSELDHITSSRNNRPNAIERKNPQDMHIIEDYLTSNESKKNKMPIPDDAHNITTKLRSEVPTVNKVPIKSNNIEIEMPSLNIMPVETKVFSTLEIQEDHFDPTVSKSEAPTVNKMPVGSKNIENGSLNKISNESITAANETVGLHKASEANPMMKESNNDTEKNIGCKSDLNKSTFNIEDAHEGSDKLKLDETANKKNVNSTIVKHIVVGILFMITIVHSMVYFLPRRYLVVSSESNTRSVESLSNSNLSLI